MSGFSSINDLFYRTGNCSLHFLLFTSTDIEQKFRKFVRKTIDKHLFVYYIIIKQMFGINVR